MRDPFSWSFPIGSIAGIAIRIHMLFPVVVAGLILREVFRTEAIPGTWIDAAMVLALLFISVLLHEFGHSFAARFVGGDSDSVLLWPLGGLSRCQHPHTPWATFVVAIGGPLVNIALFLLSALILAFAFDASIRPPMNPIYAPYRIQENGMIALVTWAGDIVDPKLRSNLAVILLVRFFWVNWVLALLNLLLVGLPFDSGRILQSALWPRLGYHQATRYAIFSGFVVMFVLLVATLVTEAGAGMLLMIALMTYIACKEEWIALEGGNDDSVFGYDFSQGYTSLERSDDDVPAPKAKRKKENFFQRWKKRRAAHKIFLEQERQEAEDRRMDELLEKIRRTGKESLTDEEQRFLKRVADRYRNKPS